MKKIIITLLLLCSLQNAQEIQENTQEKQEIQNPAFLPAKVTSPYYAAFGINLTYANFKHPKYFDTSSFNSLIFTLDTGWFLGEERANTLIGLYLDGGAGGGKAMRFMRYLAG